MLLIFGTLGIITSFIGKKIYRKHKNGIFNSFVFCKVTDQKHRKINFRSEKNQQSIVYHFENSQLQRLQSKIRTMLKSYSIATANTRRWFCRCERQPLHSKTICGSPNQKKKKTPTETEHIKETEPKEKRKKNEMERTSNSHRYIHTRADARLDTIFWFARDSDDGDDVDGNVKQGKKSCGKSSNEGDRECVQKKNESARDHQHHHY